MAPGPQASLQNTAQGTTLVEGFEVWAPSHISPDQW